MSRKDAGNVAKLAADYVAFEVARDEAFDKPAKANRFFDKAHAVAVRLRSTEEGRAALLSLLEHDDRGVRLGAAAECTPFAPKQAKKVLKDLIADRGRHSFDAEMTLKELDAGRLDMEW